MLPKVIIILLLILSGVSAQVDYYTFNCLIMAHGSLMVITFLLLVPMGIFWAHFGRKLVSGWVNGHMSGMLLIAIFPFLTAFLCAYFAVTPDNFQSDHTKIGLTIFLLIWIQIFLGLINHTIHLYRIKKNIIPQIRPWHNYIHLWLGQIVAILGICNIPIGLKLYGAPTIFYILYAVWIFILICTFIVFEVYTKQKMNILDDKLLLMYL